MSKFSRKFLGLMVIGLGLLTFSHVSFAAENENSLTGFLRNLFHYPVKATQETAAMTANTLSNTGEKVVSRAGESAADVLHADIPAAGRAVANTAVGGAQTAGQAVSETAQIPVKAAE